MVKNHDKRAIQRRSRARTDGRHTREHKLEKQERVRPEPQVLRVLSATAVVVGANGHPPQRNRNHWSDRDEDEFGVVVRARIDALAKREHNQNTRMRERRRSSGVALTSGGEKLRISRPNMDM